MVQDTVLAEGVATTKSYRLNVNILAKRALQLLLQELLLDLSLVCRKRTEAFTFSSLVDGAVNSGVD